MTTPSTTSSNPGPFANEIADRVGTVRDRLTAIGRPDVRLIAVTKGFPAEAVTAAAAAGVGDFGESYAQEFVAKVAKVAALWPDEQPRWHFIGGLQRNKVRKMVEVVDLWHSVDRPELIHEVANRSTGPDPASILLQVDIFDEQQKGGCVPADVEALLGIASEAGVVVRGLMAMAPYGDAEAARPGFRELANLAEGFDLPELSMGMSGDYEVAASEGATMIRVGSAIFGARPHR